MKTSQTSSYLFLIIYYKAKGRAITLPFEILLPGVFIHLQQSKVT